jgi:large subunit ribosomal protein L17
MRHHKDHRKLGRNSAHRRAMLRNLVTSLLEHEQVRTTTARAKEVRRVAEQMITLGKHGGLANRREALRTLRSKQVASKVFGELASRYADRAGGYTRIARLGSRHGDNAEMAVIQLLGAESTRQASSGS